MRRILFTSWPCYLDDSNGAAVASRTMMECLARHGFAVAALSGTILEHGREIDPVAWLSDRGLTSEVGGGHAASAGAHDLGPGAPRHYRLQARGVPVILHPGTTTRLHPPDSAEYHDFMGLYVRTLDRFRPDVVVNYGGDPLSHRVRAGARDRGAAVVFPLHNFSYTTPDPFATADAVIVPSRFAADHYRRTLRLDCRLLPYLIDPQRVRAEARAPRFVTFVNPSYEKGVYAFARIADELGRRRPDIPLLVVESRGTEETLVNCGVDLRAHGNISLMSHTPDPRQFWCVTRIALLPSLWWENQPLVAIEAMVNGVPVIGSDRGGIPETLGDAGVVLSLPARLTPATRDLPTPAEVASWVDAVIALWDNPSLYANQSRLALFESQRWSPSVLELHYLEFFKTVRRRAG